MLDHHQRSKLRILIESALIDLNEEIFAISEVLARSFSSATSPTQASRGLQVQKAREFQDRHRILMRKVQEQIDENHAVKVIRRQGKL